MKKIQLKRNVGLLPQAGCANNVRNIFFFGDFEKFFFQCWVEKSSQ
jgi:hypothetical protein